VRTRFASPIKNNNLRQEQKVCEQRKKKPSFLIIGAIWHPGFSSFAQNPQFEVSIKTNAGLFQH